MGVRTKEVANLPLQANPSLESVVWEVQVQEIPAQYVNCAAANSGADAGMYDASEQYKLSTWQQVPHRGNPFRDKGGLRGQRQSGSCSKRHHVTREEDFSGRQRVFETLHDCTSISQPT